MLPVGSFGSADSVPTEFCSKAPLTFFHVGLAASASSVRQTPPPEAPAHMRQSPGVHDGAISSAGVRVAVALFAPEKASTPGSNAMLSGPYCCQTPLPLEDDADAEPPDAFLIFSNVASAFAETASGMTLAG